MNAASCGSSESSEETKSETIATEQLPRPEETEKPPSSEAGKQNESEDSDPNGSNGTESSADTSADEEEVTQDPNQGEWDPQP